MTSGGSGRSQMATAVAVALAILSGGGVTSAEAAGLGRLTVQSALGQPLRAEVEVTSVSPDEAESLKARIASPEAFSRVGLQYKEALSGVRMDVENRGGRYFIKVTSSRPINDPFVDLVVELSWASGTFSREYTFLLDPHGYFQSVRGSFHHRDVVGMDEGSVIETDTGHELLLLRPLLADYVLVDTEIDREITIGATTLRCRMDAVFRRLDGSGWLIVDWKTGRRRVPVDQLSVYVHAWAASQGVPTGSVRAAYVYVDYPGGRVDELTAAGLLDLDQIESALTPGSPPDEMTPLPAPEQQG